MYILIYTDKNESILQQISFEPGIPGHQIL